MKVLLVNHFPLEGSGSGVYTNNLGLELLRCGHEVLAIAPDNYPITGFPYPVKTILFSDGENANFDFPFNFPCFTTHPRSNNTYYNLSDSEIEDYIRAFSTAMEEAIKEFSPDIIHCQHLWIAPYCASKLNIPYIATAHGTDLKGFVKDERYHKYVLEGAQKAAYVITISKQVDDDTEKLYKIPAENRKLILNGVDENIFFPKEIRKADVYNAIGVKELPQHLVSFVGKLAHFKGVDVLLDAAAIYEAELEGVLTLIIGHGEKEEELKKQRERLGLQNVKFLGHKTQQQIADIYNVADVSVVPSRTEPFGLVAIEALACGAPVVATNQGGLPDFIDDKIGSLVPVEDAAALARAIVNEILNPNRLEKRQAAAKEALENFSWKRVLGEVIAVYEEAINKGGAL